MLIRLTILTSLLGLYCSAQPVGDNNLLQKQADIEQLKQVLIAGQAWVKYPAYSDRAGWNRLTGDLKQSIIDRGERYLDYEWKVIPATAYLEYEKSGSRDIMQAPYGANNSALSALVAAELAEGDGRFTGQIINGVWHSCDMTSWVLSAHLHSLQKSRRALPDVEEQIIDLTSGDVGSLLAWTWYFLKDEMDKADPAIARRLRNELQKRILDPYIERSDFWWQALSGAPDVFVNNWNPWCNFNVLTCYLLLENIPDKLAQAVYKTMVSTDKFINYTKADGACEEGPSYWGHAAGKLYDYLQLLSYATGGQVSVFNHPKIKNMGEYIAYSYIGNGWVVNFADASAKGGGDAGVIFRYGKAVESSDMKQFGAYLYQQNGGRGYPGSGSDLFRQLESLDSYDEFLQETPQMPARHHVWYPDTEFCYIRNNNGLFFAAKGGHNNESHNHNDIGSFLLYSDAYPVFIDVGVGTYTRQTFSSERYTIWTMQSGYHNIPEINGVSQIDGRRYRSAEVKYNEKTSVFSLDIAGAYPAEAAVESWVRTYTLGQPDKLVISDRFRLSQSKEPNRVHFMILNEPDISNPGTVSINVNDRQIKLLYDKNTFVPAVEKIDLDDRRLSGAWGESVYRLVLSAKTLHTKDSYQFIIQQ